MTTKMCLRQLLVVHWSILVLFTSLKPVLSASLHSCKYFIDLLCSLCILFVVFLCSFKAYTKSIAINTTTAKSQSKLAPSRFYTCDRLSCSVHRSKSHHFLCFLPLPLIRRHHRSIYINNIDDILLLFLRLFLFVNFHYLSMHLVHRPFSIIRCHLRLNEIITIKLIVNNEKTE